MQWHRHHKKGKKEKVFGKHDDQDAHVLGLLTGYTVHQPPPPLFWSSHCSIPFVRQLTAISITSISVSQVLTTYEIGAMHRKCKKGVRNVLPAGLSSHEIVV